MARDDFNFSLWRRVIAIGRLLLLIALTLVTAVSLAVGRLLLGLWPRARRRWRVLHFSLWARAVVFCLGGRTIWHGRPPAAPFFLASNHLGYLDIVVLAQRLPAVFVSKADVRRWPVVGWLTRLADTLYINRERRRDIPRANTMILDALHRGEGVVLFPEGTSSGSDRMLPARPSLLEVAASHGYPVHTAAIHFQTRGGDPHAHRAISYFGDMEFGSHLWNVLHLRGFTATIRYAAEPVQAPDRKALAVMVRERIHRLQQNNHSDCGTATLPDTPQVVNESRAP